MSDDYEPGSAREAIAKLDGNALRVMADKVEAFDPKRAEFLREQAKQKDEAEK